MRHANKYMMNDIIVFENLRFRPSTRKRKAGFFRSLHSGKRFLWKDAFSVTVFTRYVLTVVQTSEKNHSFQIKTDTCGRGPQWRQRNVQKLSVLHVQSLLFCFLDLLVFWRSRCRCRVRFCCVRSVMKKCNFFFQSVIWSSMSSFCKLGWDLLIFRFRSPKPPAFCFIVIDFWWLFHAVFVIFNFFARYWKTVPYLSFFVTSVKIWKTEKLSLSFCFIS